MIVLEAVLKTFFEVSLLVYFYLRNFILKGIMVLFFLKLSFSNGNRRVK